jgi:hypothetical protein
MGQYNRDVSIRKALRKRRISRYDYYYRAEEKDYYDNLHQYSKNKVHCSCPSCQAKTRNKGHRRYKPGNYNRNLNYKASELRRLLAMDEEEMEYEGARIWRPNRCKYESC